MSKEQSTSQGLRGWWKELPAATRRPLWPAGLAVLVIAAQLAGFHQIMRDAVRHGEALRLTAATPQQALNHCGAVRTEHMLERCIAALAPGRSLGISTPPNTASLQPADADS